jgi:hypothetical protein
MQKNQTNKSIGLRVTSMKFCSDDKICCRGYKNSSHFFMSLVCSSATVLFSWVSFHAAL